MGYKMDPFYRGNHGPSSRTWVQIDRLFFKCKRCGAILRWNDDGSYSVEVGSDYCPRPVKEGAA